MPFTPAQIIHVSRLARHAYQAWSGRAAHERAAGGCTQGFTAWRHEQQDAALGVRSLHHAASEDYKTLLSHFHRLRMGYLQAAATNVKGEP